MLFVCNYSYKKLWFVLIENMVVVARIISISAVKKDELIKQNIREQTPKQYQQNVYNLTCTIILQDLSEVLI